MFTTECFIRKNTPELKKRLEELGYISHIYNNDDANNIYVDKLGTYISVDIENQPYYIDCNENEELFLSLAALRDDTDKYQWFYSTGWTNFEGNPLPDKWVFCDQDTLEHFAWVNNSPNSYKTGWKKATVEELIKHFK